MARTNLSDAKVRSLKPIAGKRYDVMDAQVPGFGVRVTDKGLRTFILLSRFPGSSNPTRRALGEYPAMSLEKARIKAGHWRNLIKNGIDPAIEEEKELRAALKKQENTFGVVVEVFIADKLSIERRGAEAEQDIRRELLPKWARRPITDIADLDVLEIINAKKRTAPVAARNLLALIKRFFSWAIDQREYGLQTSPCQHLRPARLIGERVSADRVLTDDEIFALWRAAGRLGYPHGPVYRLLLLTGLRLNECADAAWSEIDLKERLWVVPAARMKGKHSRARAHAVPLSDASAAVLETVPRFKTGDYVFSTDFGEKPCWMTTKVKARLDARMLRTLRALARSRGEDSKRVTLSVWTNHDIRRTVRSRLSRLKIAEEVREAVLAHVRPGIKATYDVHDYLEEKREALELWAGRVRLITMPQQNNVVPLHKAS